MGTRNLNRGRRDVDATTNRCHDPAVEITAAVISEPYSPLVVVRVAARKTWRRGSNESFRRAAYWQAYAASPCRPLNENFAEIGTADTLASWELCTAVA